MKGLLIKDLLLTKKQWKFLLLIFVISIFLMMTNSGYIFVINYILFLLAMQAVGTMAYDEYENGYPYLLTMPVSRKTYVREKYLLAALYAGGGIVLAYGLVRGMSFVRETQIDTKELWVSLLASLMVLCVYDAVLIPIRLKYGVERSKIVSWLIFGGALVLFGGISYIKGFAATVKVAAAGFGRWMNTHALNGCLLGVLLLTAVIFMSYRFSVRIMERKEY